MAKAKKITWKYCRDFTIRMNPSWAEGRGGRKSALSNSDKFTKEFNRSPDFSPYNITKLLILEDQTELKEDQGLRHGTLNRYKSAVAAVLNYCHGMGVLDQNWTVPRFYTWNENDDKLMRKAFTAEQVHALISFARDRLCNQNLADIIAFAALTGIRQGKILELTNDRIDLHNRMILVTKPKNQNQEARHIGIHNTLIPMLAERMARQEPTGYTFRDDWGGHNMKSRQKNIERPWHKCISMGLGLPTGNGSPYCFHGLRHTCGTLMALSGRHIIEIKEHLGHTSTKTCERYLHARDDQAVARANSIDFSLSDKTIVAPAPSFPWQEPALSAAS